MNIYDCYRCGFHSNRKSTMKNHLNKIKKCKRIIDSFKYSDEECYELSLINKNKHTTERIPCELCKKTFSTKYNLDKHNCNSNTSNSKSIKSSNDLVKSNDLIDSNDLVDSDDLVKSNDSNNKVDMTNQKEIKKEDEKIQNIQHNIINNNTTNIIFINNIHNKTPIAFNREWTTDHIDIHIKQLLYLTDYKYTKLLTKILEEDSNLNVILDKKEKTGYVYDENKKSYIDMNKSDIISESMKKLYNGLLKMKEEFNNEDNIEKIYISTSIINNQSDIVETKYNEYIKNDTIKKTVENCIIDIFEEKKRDALKIYDYTKNNNKKVELSIGF